MTVPSSYTWLRRGRVRLWVRDDVVTRLAPWLLDRELEAPPGWQPLTGGRGGGFRIDLGGGLDVVVRPGRRGGWLGRLVERTYLGRTPRFVRELLVAAAARAHGVPTPAVLAARVEGWWIYRGAVVTETIPGARTLVEALRDGADPAASASLARAAGRAVGALHAAGVDHPDLNLTNLLAAAAGAAEAVAVIDLDKARAMAAPLPPRVRRRGIARLARSWRKLVGDAPPRALIAAFREGYAEAGEPACAS
jgi:3-deoxy-D-manno-octulosonic acid kinase